MECKVSKVITEQPHPIIVDFQNGEFDPSEQLEANCVRNGKNVTFEVGPSNKVYKGSISDDDTNNFIVMRNKKTNKLKLIQVDHATVFPYIEKQAVSAPLLLTDKATVAEVNKQFGSKRTKRRTEQIERMKLDVEHVREHLENTVADVEVEDRNLEIPDKINENDSNYRPPINRNASSKDQVYVLDTLVSKVVLDSLEEEATAILENDLDQYEIRPLTRKKLLELRKSNTSNAVLKCEIFLYIDCLLNFLMTPVKQLNRTYRACTYSYEVDKHILDNFSITSGNSRNRPLSMKDKCICYALILLTLASDYTVNLEDFTQEVKLGLKKLQEIARVLGLSVSGSIITLRLPLPAPVIFNAKRKRR